MPDEDRPVQFHLRLPPALAQQVRDACGGLTNAGLAELIAEGVAARLLRSAIAAEREALARRLQDLADKALGL